jgi:hypothetical protein
MVLMAVSGAYLGPDAVDHGITREQAHCQIGMESVQAVGSAWRCHPQAAGLGRHARGRDDIHRDRQGSVAVAAAGDHGEITDVRLKWDIADTVDVADMCMVAGELDHADSHRKMKSCPSCSLCYDEIRQDSGTATGGIRNLKRN